MATMTGGDAIVEGLRAHGVDTVFGLPGAQIYGLFDALHRAGIRVVGARHEQACGYMAFGAARATGRPAVCAVVPGPGLLNAGAALLTSFGANEPVLCLTGQTPRAFLDRGHGHLHEMPDQLATVGGVVKWAHRIEHPAQAPALVARAFDEMCSGRPGPAVLEMPWDVFTERAAVEPVGRTARSPGPPVDQDAVTRAAELIATSRAPMIFVGSGAIDAAGPVLELAERIDAPVVAFRSGRGIVSNAHELGLTIAEAHQLWDETDLAIGIGTRMEVARWRWPAGRTDRRIIRVDIDPVEMRRLPPDVAVVADASAATAALAAAVAPGDGSRRVRIREAREKTQERTAAVRPQIDYLAAVRAVLPEDGIVVDEMSQVGFTSWFGYPVHRPRTFISSGYQGTLGAGFATALGAKVARPASPVVAICGDGGFMFGVQELATAVQYGIGVVTLVFNNGSYGNVRRDQLQAFDGRVVGADLVNPDFVRLAEAFGVPAARIGGPDELAPVLERALSDGGPWLIDVEVPPDSESSPWPFIAPQRMAG